MTMNNTLKGYVCGIIAAATYGLNPLFALPLYAHGLNPDSVLFFRYLCAIPIVGLMAVLRGHSLKIEKRDIIPLALMGIITALSSLTLFISYNYMNAGIASTILFVYPVLVALLMAVIYRERLSAITLVCMIVALAGIVLLAKAPEGSSVSLIGVLLAFLSGLTYAIYIVAANRKQFKKLPTLKMLFYVLLFGTLVFVVRLMGSTTFTPPTSVMDWGCVIALAVFPTALSFGGTTMAIHYIGSTPTAILGALEPLTAVAVSIAVFGESVTGREWIGMAMIILAVTCVAAAPQVSSLLLRIRKMFPRKR